MSMIHFWWAMVYARSLYLQISLQSCANRTSRYNCRSVILEYFVSLATTGHFKARTTDATRQQKVVHAKLPYCVCVCVCVHFDTTNIDADI